MEVEKEEDAQEKAQETLLKAKGKVIRLLFKFALLFLHMLISVVIGALNEEKYIGKTLASLQKQNTTFRYEMIVGDGYSSDKTVSIARKFGAKVVKEKNRSAAWERQAGAKTAKGEIIAFSDADAEFPSDWVQNAALEFEKDEKLVMLYGPVYFSDTPSIEKSLSKISMMLYLAVLSFLGIHNPIGSNMVVRRKEFEKIGGLDTSLVTCEDLDLAKRMKPLGKVKFVPGVFVNVSARRIKKWGYIRFTVFHIINGLRFQFTGKAEHRYEPVR